MPFPDVTPSNVSGSSRTSQVPTGDVGRFHETLEPGWARTASLLVHYRPCLVALTRKACRCRSAVGCRSLGADRTRADREDVVKDRGDLGVEQLRRVRVGGEVGVEDVLDGGLDAC